MPRQHCEHPSQPPQSAFTISFALYKWPSEISARLTFCLISSPSASLCLAIHNLLQALRVRCSRYTVLRYNTGNQFMIRHIECRIVDLYTLRSHAFLIPHLSNLFRLTLFDADISTGGSRHINSGSRCTDVYRHTVLFCHCCHHAGTDLVRSIAVGCHSVTTYEYSLYPALGHDRSGHIVTDQCHIHTCGMQFKCCQSGSL